jgi:hypothetical protein
MILIVALGFQNSIFPGDPIEYILFFENPGNDLLHAKRPVILDTGHPLTSHLKDRAPKT